MRCNLPYNRTLLLVVTIIHLLVGFSYDHARVSEEGGIFHAGDIYLSSLSSEGVQNACHDEQPDDTKTTYAADCVGQCLSCCAHGPCGLPTMASTLGTLPLSSRPITLDPFAKEIHPLIEPRPPRSLRHYA